MGWGWDGEHTQQCSGVAPGSTVRNNSWQVQETTVLCDNLVFSICRKCQLSSSEISFFLPAAIVNRDGTRYVQRGEYRTNPNDINPSNAPDEDISSGSSSERSTSGDYILHTNLPTIHPTQDQDKSWVSNSPKNTPTHGKENGTPYLPIAVLWHRHL